MKLWHIVAIVGAGIAFGMLQPGQFTYALGHATLYVFLPPLLFEASWNLNVRAIRRQWAAIATLAGPGVLLTAAIVAGALSIVHVPFGPAFLTGAILSATDPIAVIAVFRRMRVPRTLATIVECESLFNDAVAVALYRIVLGALAAGAIGMWGTTQVVLQTAVGAVAGVAIGVALAYATASALRRATGATLQIVATAIVAYGAYFIADALSFSGIFATIAGGIALRYFERRWIALSIAGDVNRFWDLAALVANVLVFFMVGAALRIGDVAREPTFIVATLIAIAVSRAVVAGLLLPCGFPRAWLDVVRVAGMRGALSLALAIALPGWVPYRQAIVDATFAVVLATLAVSTLTVARAARLARKEAASS
jgi:CPA1 family monovalent cation:H+ antiporter